jgi:hypothetical protein
LDELGLLRSAELLCVGNSRKEEVEGSTMRRIKFLEKVFNLVNGLTGRVTRKITEA